MLTDNESVLFDKIGDIFNQNMMNNPKRAAGENTKVLVSLLGMYMAQMSEDAKKDIFDFLTKASNDKKFKKVISEEARFKFN